MRNGNNRTKNNDTHSVSCQMRHATSSLQRWQCVLSSDSRGLNVLCQPKTANTRHLAGAGTGAAGGAPPARVCSNTFVAIAIIPAISLRFAGTTSVLLARARLPNC